MNSPPKYRDAAGLAQAVSAILEPAFERIERLAAAIAASRPNAGAGWSERDLAGVRKLILDQIGTDDLYLGMGFVAAPGIIDGHERYMLWWQQEHGQVSRLRPNFDRSSIDVYDYVEMDWFRLAEAGHPRVTFGPYVDYSGADRYIVTATVPVIVDGADAGVAGADLLFGALERRLVRVLREASSEALIVNADRRIVAANTPRWVHGSRLHSLPEPGARLREFTVVDVAEPPVGVGWVLALTDADRR